MEGEEDMMVSPLEQHEVTTPLTEDELQYLLEQRKDMAKYWCWRHAYRIPLEEYISAGNLGIAEGLDTFDVTKNADKLLHIRQYMQHTMQKVLREEKKLGNKIPQPLHPQLAHRGYLRCLIKELYWHLSNTVQEKELYLYDLWVLGYSFEQIKRKTGSSVSAAASSVWRTKNIAKRFFV
jgi:hypothetical protein